MLNFLGNQEVMKRYKIAFFASSRVASLSVLPTLDWTAEVARRDDIDVVSGFHSKMEREVLDYLLRGKCGIICVLARSIYKKIPGMYREAYNESRILFISPCKNSSSMISRHLCQQRNEYVASISDELVFSSLTSESSLYNLVSSDKKTTILWAVKLRMKTSIIS